MREFFDEHGEAWVASAREEHTPRHHGRWYLVFHRAGDDETLLPMPEVRWQTRATAERTLRTLSDFELRRRLTTVLARAGGAPPRSAGKPGGGWSRPETTGERSTATAPADGVSGSESAGLESTGED